MKKGGIISFEGIDCCGKTTQIRMAAKWLEQRSVEYVMRREPGDTSLGGVLRHVLKYPSEAYAALNSVFAHHPDYKPVDVHEDRTAEAETLLFIAARAEFRDKVLLPAIEGGKLALVDRMGDSTVAYQGGGLYGSDPEKVGMIKAMNRFVLGDVWPDRTYFLDIAVSTVARRMGAEKADYIESRGPEFFERARAEYHNIAREEPHRVVVVNAERPPREVFEECIVPDLERYLASR